LEVRDYLDREFRLFTECLRFASIVGPVSKFLAHETVSVMTVEGLLREIFISLEVTGPRESGPTHASRCCMRVSRLTGIEVPWVSE
jgi:hypothetical protein